MNYDELFIELLHRLESYDDAMVLSVLLALGADEVPVVCTVGQLRQNQMAGALTPNRVALSVDRLEARGLLSLRRRSGRSRLVEFSASGDAILELLRNPVAYARCTPGNGDLTVPFLSTFSGALELASDDDAQARDMQALSDDPAQRSQPG